MNKLNCLGSSLLLAVLFTMPALAGTAADEVLIADPYARAVPPVSKNSAVFMTLKNMGTADHALVSASSDAAEVVELHTHVNDDGVMRMRKIDQISVKAGDSAVLEPGGLHVMLLGLTRTLSAGETVQVEFAFDDGSTKTVVAAVKSVSGMHHGGGHGKHHGKADQGKHHGGGHGKHHGKAGQGKHHGGGHGKHHGKADQGKHHGGGHGKHHGKAGHGKEMRHANPMPNLMKVIKKQGDTLGLSDQQKEELNRWHDQNADTMHARFAKVGEMEKKLNTAALAGTPKAELMGMASQIMNLRTDIIRTKIDCRDNMRRVLTPAQYEQALILYKPHGKKH